MNRQYIKKIRNVLNEALITVPYVFQQFYSILKKSTIGLDKQELSHIILQKYANIFTLLKKYFQDEPFSLTKSRKQIRKQLQNLLNPFMDFLPIDFISEQIVINFRNQSLIEQVQKLKFQSECIMKECLEKNNKIKIYGNNQLANIFWVVKFKQDYAVHFDIFWQAFLQFCNQFSYYSHFVSNSSKKFIRKIVDPDKKYYVTSTNVNSLFLQLSQPQLLQVLHDITSKNQKVENFVSYDLLVMKFYLNEKSSIETQLIDKSQFNVCGQDVEINKVKKNCKYPPTIRFGSAADSDVQIKSKFISRKQFMIIQEQEESLNQKINFSIVCLSPSNFTLLSFKTQYKLKPGSIFKVGNSSYQVLKISNFFQTQQDQFQKTIQQQKDQTLDYLPDKVIQQSNTQKQLQYIQLAGNSKGERGKLNYKNLIIQNSQNKLKLLYQEKNFFLPPQTLIYAKNANQVINGQLSDKIRIQEGMKIVLEQCYFQIDTS